MTSTTPTPLLSQEHPLLDAVPRLLGYVPRESLVLVPLRAGSPTGALRFSLPDREPVSAARAYLGALGRFGRAESAVAVLYTAGSNRSGAGVIDALRERARCVGLGELVVLRAPDDGTRSDGPGRAGAPRHAAAQSLLPLIARDQALEVAAQVDALLDRHPTAQLPPTIVSSVDAALRRAAAGGGETPRTSTLAALVVCAQRPEWARRTLEIARGTADPALVSLLARAAAVAPATERAAVLVLLAVVLRLTDRRDEAVSIARWAAFTDPHELSARLLLAVLESRDEADGPLSAMRAA